MSISYNYPKILCVTVTMYYDPFELDFDGFYPSLKKSRGLSETKLKFFKVLYLGNYVWKESDENFRPISKLDGDYGKELLTVLNEASGENFNKIIDLYEHRTLYPKSNWV